MTPKSAVLKKYPSACATQIAGRHLIKAEPNYIRRRGGPGRGLAPGWMRYPYIGASRTSYKDAWRDAANNIAGIG